MDQDPLVLLVPNSFARDLRSCMRIWLPSAVAAAAASWWLAANGLQATMLEWVVWLPIGLLLVPLGFTLGLASCVVVLAMLLGVLSVPAWLTGRAIGLAAVLADAWRLAAHVLPGFWRALRRVRRPGLWGALLGVFVGTVTSAAVHGFG
jgi:hypothetical protein